MLYGPVLTAALSDTADQHRFQIYGRQHENMYFGGRFDGWYWYIARARLEIEAARGRWPQALEAARICTRARPLAGVEWYLLASCAAHAYITASQYIRSVCLQPSATRASDSANR